MIISLAILGAMQLAATPANLDEVGQYQLAYPAPSPDGRELVFQGDFDGRFQLYRMEVETGHIERLHTSVGNDSNPVWSPDGSQVAFVSDRDGNPEIYMLDIETGIASAIAPHPGNDGHPKFSTDGRHLWFNRTFDPADRTGDEDAAILRLELDSGEITIVSDSPFVETYPAPSPDGQQVALVEWRDGEDGTPGSNTEIIVYNLNSGERTNISNYEGFDGFPAWGDDGWIYYISHTRLSNGQREYDLYRGRPDGSEIQALTASNGVPEFRPMLDLQNRIIYLNQSRNGRVTIHAFPMEPR